MKELKVVTLDAATYYDRGVQYGQQAKEEIDIAVTYYREQFGEVPGWKKILEFSKQFIDVSKEFFPEAIDEMKGIAEGSGHTVEELKIGRAHV